MEKQLFFFLGTEAELIKIFPVIIEAKKRGVSYKIIASGQNNIVESRIFQSIECGTVDLELSKEREIKKSAVGLLSWWIKTYRKAAKMIRATFPETDFENSKILVHGDTVSTYMGARIGKKLGMTVCHVEAGLRSHHLFNPFPEEIDRLLTSRIARMHFAPGEEAVQNLKKAKGVVVNTQQNTLLDSLKYSETVPVKSEIKKYLDEDYFVFVMHRQENLASKSFVSEVVHEVVQAAQTKKCIIILHEITKNAFTSMGLMSALEANSNIIMFPRVDYFDFMKLLNHSAFVITDGGSNQEELYYMKKPCLIIRTSTERSEGLGINARLFNGNPTDIGTFVESLECINCSGGNLMPDIIPSKNIIDNLQN